MQRGMLSVMSGAATINGIRAVHDQVTAIYRRAVQDLPGAPVPDLAINRRISRLTYAHRCIEGAAVNAYRDEGVAVAPGSKVSYVVRDARKYKVDPVWSAESFDLPYYRDLLDKAWGEIAYAFDRGTSGRKRPRDSIPLCTGEG
jgi:DNA polymerase elongation subunit (family B)